MMKPRLNTLALVIAILVAWTNVASAWHMHKESTTVADTELHSIVTDSQVQHDHHNSDHCCHASAHLIALPRFSTTQFSHPHTQWHDALRTPLLTLNTPPDNPPPIV